MQSNMSEQEKKRQRIYDLLNAETKEKISEIIGVSLCPPSAQNLTPLITLYGAFEEIKQIQFPIQISVRLRLQFRRNGIKFLKNFF